MPVQPHPFPSQPMLNPVYEVLYLDQRIRFGLGPSFAADVEDPDGSFAALIRLLDGSRSIAELQQQLAAVLADDEVLDALEALHASGLLEDPQQPVPDNLTEHDLARYAVNVNFFRSMVPPGQNCYQPQSDLKDTRVLLLGLGGIGSNVCMALAELGVGYVYAVDFDRVDISNLNRQVLYGSDVLGERKIDAARRRIQAFNPDIVFEAEDQRLSSSDDVDEIIRRVRPDYLYCLADKPNGLIDFWVNAACVRNSLPYSAGVVSGYFGNAYTVLPGAGPCYQCRVDGELAESPELREPLAYIQDRELSSRTAALGPACMFIAYFLAYELLRYRFDFMGGPVAGHRLLEIDFNTFDQRWHDSQRRGDCPVCGSVPAVALPAVAS